MFEHFSLFMCFVWLQQPAACVGVGHDALQQGETPKSAPNLVIVDVVVLDIPHGDVGHGNEGIDDVQPLTAESLGFLGPSSHIHKVEC